MDESTPMTLAEAEVLLLITRPGVTQTSVGAMMSDVHSYSGGFYSVPEKDYQRMQQCCAEVERLRQENVAGAGLLKAAHTRQDQLEGVVDDLNEQIAALRNAYNDGWSAGYDAALEVLRNLGAPVVIEALEDTFIGSSGITLAVIVENYRGVMRETTRPHSDDRRA